MLDRSGELDETFVAFAARPRLVSQSHRVVSRPSRANPYVESTPRNVIDRNEVLGEYQGCRKLADVTSGPRRIVVVTVAAATSVGTIENHAASRKDRHERWSYV